VTSGKNLKYAQIAALAFLFGTKLLSAMSATGKFFFFFLAELTAPALSGDWIVYRRSTVATIEYSADRANFTSLPLMQLT